MNSRENHFLSFKSGVSINSSDSKIEHGTLDRFDDVIDEYRPGF